MAQENRGSGRQRWGLIGLAVVVLAVRAKQARDAYVREVSAGNKPIEGVGTAVAAFVGLLPAGPFPIRGHEIARAAGVESTSNGGPAG
jgi:hypothetical protein